MLASNGVTMICDMSERVYLILYLSAVQSNMILYAIQHTLYRNPKYN